MKANKLYKRAVSSINLSPIDACKILSYYVKTK